MSDLISRNALLDALNKRLQSLCGYENADFRLGIYNCIEIVEMLPSADRPKEWIPFKKRPLTDEEKEEYPDWIYIFDCPLPDDEEEILLSNGKHVWTDTFINDGECYLDGGDDIDEGMAWMPMPKPYKGGEKDET